MKLFQSKFQSLFSGSLQSYENPLLEFYISSTHTHYLIFLSIIFLEKSPFWWHDNISNHNQSPDIHRIPPSYRNGKKTYSISVSPTGSQNYTVHLHKAWSKSSTWYLSLTHLIQLFHVPDNLLWIFHLQYSCSDHHPLLFVLRSEIKQTEKFHNRKTQNICYPFLSISTLKKKKITPQNALKTFTMAQISSKCS